MATVVFRRFKKLNNSFYLHLTLNINRKVEKNINIDVCTDLELYNLLIHLVNSQREAVDEYEKKALSKIKNKTYQSENSIRRRKSIPL